MALGNRKVKSREVLRKMAEQNFIDGFDSYETEYERWRKNPIVKQLAGVYELDADTFYEASSEEKLKRVGKGHFSVLQFDCDISNDGSCEDRSSVATGVTIALRDPYGKICPIIFVRESINHSGNGQPMGDEDRGVKAAIKVLVLMHEMGHAEDVARGINFKHDTLKMDLIAAEVYAHSFVCRHAKRMNYRFALNYYLENLKDHAVSEHDVLRLSAGQAMKTLDMPALRKAATFPTDDRGIEQMLRKAGRLEEVRRESRANQSS